MSDTKVGTYGATFSELYQAVETARGGGRVKGSKVLYLKNTTNKSSTVSATKFWAGLAGRRASALIHQTIQTEYGNKVAMRVFKQVLGQTLGAHPGHDFPKVSLDKLRALRKVLRYERKLPLYRHKGIAPAKFSTMRRNMAELKTKRKEDGKGDLERGKHLRFTAKNGLYVHTKWSTGFKNRFGNRTSREDKRAAAGTAIWKSIAEEYNESIADEVFSNVFGKGAFRASGKDHKIAVTMQQFKAIESAIDSVGTDKERLNDAKKFLDTIRYTQEASPLDALAALFGPPQDNDTKAALKRLEKVASRSVMQTLRQRPKALLDYMRDKSQLLSLLERAAEEAVDDDKKKEIIGDFGKYDYSPEKSAARKTWQAVFGRWPGGAVAFDDAEPVDQRLTDQNIRALLDTARLQALYSLIPKNLRRGSENRPALSRQQPGITYYQKIRYDSDIHRDWKHKIYPHLSVGDVRAYDDLLQIRAIARAAEKGEIRLDKESRDMLTRRTTEIRTRFERLLDNDRKNKLERETFIPALESGIKPEVKSGSPASDGKRGVAHLLKTWQSTVAKMKDIRSKIEAGGSDIAPGNLQTEAEDDNGLTVQRLWDELKPTSMKDIHDIPRDRFHNIPLEEIYDSLSDKYVALAKSLVPVWEAYQKHPWTKSMVEDYGHLGFRDDVNYLEHEELDELMAPLLARKLHTHTSRALTDAVKQAEKLEKQIADP